jgi:TonB family protein
MEIFLKPGGMRIVKHRRSCFPFVLSFFIHGMVFLPSFQIFFDYDHNKEQESIRVPDKIVFRFLPPVPQEKAEPRKVEAKIEQVSTKTGPAEQKPLEEPAVPKQEIRSIKSEEMSKALKTLATDTPSDPKKIEWDYANFIQKTIMANIEYPEAEEKSGIEDSVKISFCIDRQGRLTGEPVISELYRSRYENFNKAAVEAVKKASKNFPPIPEQLKKNSQLFSMPIVFSRPQ